MKDFGEESRGSEVLEKYGRVNADPFNTGKISKSALPCFWTVADYFPKGRRGDR